MRRRGHRGRRKEGRGKRGRRHLLLLKMLRNWD